VPADENEGHDEAAGEEQEDGTFTPPPMAPPQLGGTPPTVER